MPSLQETGKEFTKRYPKEILGVGHPSPSHIPSAQETIKKIPNPLNYRQKRK